MNDLDNLIVMIHKALMFLEAKLDDSVENADYNLRQCPSAQQAERYRDALLKREWYKELSGRLLGILDMFKNR